MKSINNLIFLFIVIGSFTLSCQDQVADETAVSMNQNTVTDSKLSKGTSSRTGDSSLDEFVGGPISLKTAQTWTANYRSKNPDQVKAHFFGYEIIKKILAQNDCIGIRMYYALDDNGEKQIILVGVDTHGNNMIPATLELNPNDTNTIADISFPCPSFCPSEEF